MWDYSEKVKDHFLNPRNVGEIEDADGVGEVGSLACGDALRLTFKLDSNGRIKDAKFKTFGCASAIATSSVLTELIKGKALNEALNVTNKDIVDFLGGLPEQKMHCSVMGRVALEAAVENYRGGGTEKHEIQGNVVCTCFGVTDKEIGRVIRENDLLSVEQVTYYCKAGGGCGSCQGQIEKILQQLQGDKLKKGEHQRKRPIGKLTNIQKIQLIQQTINEHIRPALRADGGNIELLDVEGGKVIVTFRGMCSHCRMVELTMKDVVEARLKEYVSDDLFVVEQKDLTLKPHTHREVGS